MKVVMHVCLRQTTRRVIHGQSCHFERVNYFIFLFVSHLLPLWTLSIQSFFL